MSVAGNFYQAQAANCAASAANTDLPMLRDKFERAGADWQALAKREQDIDTARERRQSEVAAQHSAASASACRQRCFANSPSACRMASSTARICRSISAWTRASTARCNRSHSLE